MNQYPLTIRRSKRLFSGTTISVRAGRGVVVTVPYWMPTFAVEQIIKDKNDWIVKQFNKISPAEKITPKKYEPGEKHLFLGKEYTLILREVDTIVHTKAEIMEEHIEVQVYSGFAQEDKREKIKEALLSCYLEKGIEVITGKVNHYCSVLGLSYKKITLKKVSSIWGSCSWQNNLNFNRKLVMAPHEVVDYVIIHEVCHMIHRDHSSRFWAAVSKLDPDFREHRRWLRTHHHLLSI